MSDVLDEQGNIYDFETFKTRFGLRGTFLDFKSLFGKFQIDGKTFILLINLMFNVMNM